MTEMLVNLKQIRFDFQMRECYASITRHRSSNFWSAAVMAGGHILRCSSSIVVFILTVLVQMTHDCQENSGGYPRRSATNFQATVIYNSGSVLTCNAKLTWLSVRHLGFIRTRRRAYMYFTARMKYMYYPNTVASLRLARLIIAGDISPNPGPKHTELVQQSVIIAVEKLLSTIEPFSARAVECGFTSSAVVSQRKSSLSGDKNNSYDRLLNWIGLHSTLEGRRIQDMLITINSCFQEKAPTPIVNLLKVKDTKYNLRGTNMLSLPKVRSTKHGLRSVRYFAAKTWNALPDSIRAMAGTREFLRSIRHVAF